MAEFYDLLQHVLLGVGVYALGMMLGPMVILGLIYLVEEGRIGFLACNRRGCDQVMCDYHSSQHGYLCTRCLEELKARAPAISIAAFMDEDKTTSSIGLERQATLEEIERTFVRT